MAQERSATPEKQLLRLIEDSKAKAAPRIEAQAIKYHSQSLFSPGAWMGRFSFLREKFKGLATNEHPHVDIVKIINGTLIIAITCLAVYFISSFTLTLMHQKKLAKLSGALQVLDARARDASTAGNLQPLTYYMDKIQQRNIFRMGAKNVGGLVAAVDASRITELTKNLKLVGISWSDNPDAMIEDTKMVRTFFVKKGQMIGEIQVKDVAKDKVVLAYEGEVVELR